MAGKNNKALMRFLVFLILISLSSQLVFTAEDAATLPQDDKSNQEQPQANGFRFIVISDVNPGYRSDLTLNSRFPKALQGIPQHNPAFVLHAGDMVGGYTNTNGAEHVDMMWAPFFEAIKAVTAANIPYLPSPGNHDEGYTEDLKEGYRRNWLKYYPNPAYNAKGNYPNYYSFDYLNNHFIMLDSARIKLGSAQIQWLSEDLKNVKNKDNTFVIMHVPFISDGMGHAETADRAALDMINDAGVKIIFAAHNHVYTEHTYKSIRQITTGTAADDRRSRDGKMLEDWIFLVVDVLGKDNVKVYPAASKSDFKKTLDGQEIPPAPVGAAPGFNPNAVAGTECVPGANADGMSALLSGEGISYSKEPFKGGEFHTITIDPNRYEVKLVSAKKATGKSTATLADIIRNTPGAVAGINAGFFKGGGGPAHTVVEDGISIKSGTGEYTFLNENGKYNIIRGSEFASYTDEQIKSRVPSAISSYGLIYNGGTVPCNSKPGFCDGGHPRSSVCITKEGTIKLLATHGVPKGSSMVGGFVSVKTFAEEAINKQSCVAGLNLDGGGSTSIEYHINGQDVSLKGERSASGCGSRGFPCQRAIGNALVVVPKSITKQQAGQTASAILPTTTTLTGAAIAIDSITGLAAEDSKSNADKAIAYSADLSKSLKIITIDSPEYLQIISAYQMTGQELATPKTILDRANEKGMTAAAVTNGAFFGYSSLKGKGNTDVGSTCIYIENGVQYLPYEYPDDSKNPEFFCKDRYEFYITKSNEMGILPYDEFGKKYASNNYADIKHAVQGVNILYDGKVITDYPKDIEFTFHGGKKERNGICITNDNKVILFVETEKIGLIDLATKLKNELNCKHAINTDGGASSSMYIKDKDYYFKNFNDDNAQNSICKGIKSAKDYGERKDGRTQGHGCAFNFFLVAKPGAATPLETATTPAQQFGCNCEQTTQNAVVTTTPSGTYDFSAIDSKYKDYGAKRDISKLNKFDKEIQEANQKYSVPPELIKGIMMVESNGEPFPAKGELCNSAGYCGLMQINKGKCSEERGCNLENFEKGIPKDQIFGGTWYLNYLINYKGIGSKDSPDFFYWIAAGYNGGEGSSTYIRKVAAQRLNIPPEQVKWKDVTIEDARKNQEHYFPKIPGKTEEIFYYPSKVMSVVQATAEGSKQTVQPSTAQQCSFDYTYDYISIGKYFVNPSFTAEIDYNLNDYKLVGDAIKNIISGCQGKSSENLRECVKDAADDNREIDNGNLLLYNGPCDYAENMFSDFTEWTDACLKSSEDNCYCQIPLEYEYEKKNTDEEISMTASGSGTVQISSTNPSIAPQSIAGGSVSGSKTITTKSSAETHYANKAGNTLTFVESGSGSKCKVNKKTYKFCAETKKQYLVYDEKEKKLALKPMQYKFAVEFMEQAAAGP